MHDEFPVRLSPPSIAQVAVERPVDTPLDYRIPPSLQPRCRVGQRVLVPLGPRLLQGYIVGLTATSAVEHLRELDDILDDAPLLTPELLRLTRWIADYYRCPLGLVIKAAIPSGFRIRSTAVYSLTPAADNHPRVWPGGQAGVLLHCLAEHGEQRREELARRLGSVNLPPLLRRLVQQGLVQTQQQRLPPSAQRRMVPCVRLRLPGDKSHTLLLQLQRQAPTQAAILQLLQQRSVWELAALRVHIPGATAAVKRLRQRGAVEVVHQEQMRQVAPLHDERPAAAPILNRAQQHAFERIKAKLDTPDGTPVLLHGVTGSGKTEVYMQAIAENLRRHRTAVVLVPEISLTNQLVERFASRFPAQVGVLHSGLSAGERFDEWRRLSSGEARIAIGARSAVFAPLPHLGLLIVDEEHDASYKQEEAPRYNARDVAIVRAQQENAVVVLGSATPSLESFYHARTGKYDLATLPERVAAKPLPPITIIDQRRHATPNERVITTPLSHAIAARLQRREQCLVLINRRGFASYLQCRECGAIPQCVRCSVSLTYHRRVRALKCHYCNFSQPAPSVCASCQGAGLQPFGLGTQQVEEALAGLFPAARIGRMDRDTTRGKASHQRILQRLQRGELDILVGTQMIAKGHDYPNITLVGVVSADATLAVPDFRAAERLFQLLTQVAGRAGRGAAPGEVFIQTYRPDHMSVCFARQHDFGGFFQDELQRRQALHYPPFARLARLVLESVQSERVQTASQWLLSVFQRHLDAPQHLVVLGPAEAPIAKIQHRYRWHLLLKATSSRLLHRWLVAALADTARDHTALRGVRLTVDVDPLMFT
jgi:primosomal protein N' (replication factor Y)